MMQVANLMRKRGKEDELIVVILFMQLVYKCLGHLLPKIEPSLFFYIQHNQ